MKIVVELKPDYLSFNMYLFGRSWYFIGGSNKLAFTKQANKTDKITEPGTQDKVGPDHNERTPVPYSNSPDPLIGAIPIDQLEPTLEIHDNGIDTEEHRERAYHPCPCILSPDGGVGVVQLNACGECIAAGEHDPGCEIPNCERGIVLLTEPCFCLREGFNKCYECILRTHPDTCLNCDGSGGIPVYLSLGS